VSRCSDSSVVLPLCSSIAADKAESGGISQFFVRDLDGSLLTIRVKDNYTTSELQKAVTEQRKKLLFERNKNFNMSSSVNLSFLQLLISNQPTLKTSSPLDLYCLLRHYFKVEKLRGCNQYACSNCTRVHHSSSSKSAEWEDSSESVKAAEGQPTILVDAVRQSAILTLPHVLTIAIKRFAFCDADFRVKKLYGFVPFHLYLDLSEFCSSTCKVPAKENSFGEYRHATPSSCLYKLQGVIEHTGTLNSGHYVSYSKISSLGFNRNSRYNNENFICSTTFNANNMKDSIYSEDKDKKYIENSEVWCYASDSELKIVSVETVLKSHAFLLFYEYVFN
jgi:ubiquitin C-terminal hydrolase